MYYLYLLLFYLFVFLLLFVLFSHIYRVFVYCALFCFPLVCFRPDLVCLFFHKYTCSIIYNYYDFPPCLFTSFPPFFGGAALPVPVQVPRLLARYLFYFTLLF